MTSEQRKQQSIAGEQELSIDDLDQASGGFNIGKFVLDAAKAEAKELARSQGCLGPTFSGFDATKIGKT
ncbi:hypothetical protein GGD63_000727 [Bradyrhizobium sp. cir1]|uniref:hypothetical protein n=1 Tax=Bradyrhizobium sp. cir1 TaxID=1445730 RepID=UPI001605F4BF|nr:hypothetical protein [Bradyrhizobium sp. cir1]MBB4367958.1 hypothetical protein [Bradyrhizobium sp. cir1]